MRPHPPLLMVAALLLLGGAGDARADKAGAVRASAEAAENAAKLAKLLNGLTPGAAQECILLRDVPSTDTVGDTILYRANRKLVYRTDTSGGCFGLARGDAIVTRTFGGDRLCRGDIIATVDRGAGIQTGSCTVGAFTPYRAAAK